MADENSLDSMLNGQPDGVSNSQPTGHNVSEVSAIQRPKLKKIKRAKVRPIAEALAIPEKIMPETTVAVSQDETALAEPPVSIQHQEENSSLEEMIPTVNQEPASEKRELVTAIDAQNLTAANETEINPYVLDGLPPELDYVEGDEEATFVNGGDFIKKKIMYIATAACFIVGLLFGKMFFASQTIENHGLEGVVTNPDVPSGRPRCGLTDKSQACVFYVMNWYKQELNGRDFYKLAAQLTGREEYMIETDNLRYANMKIKPGHFAQLNIPALK